MIIAGALKKMQSEKVKRNWKGISLSLIFATNEAANVMKKYRKIYKKKSEISMKIYVLKSEDWPQ